MTVSYFCHICGAELPRAPAIHEKASCIVTLVAQRDAAIAFGSSLCEALGLPADPVQEITYLRARAVLADKQRDALIDANHKLEKLEKLHKQLKDSLAEIWK